MNYFARLVLWQIAFILYAIVWRCALDSWVDERCVSGALVINAVMLTIASFFAFFTSRLLLSTSCAIAGLAVAISVCIVDPNIGEGIVLVGTFGGFALILFLLSVCNASEEYRLKYRWIIPTAMIEAVSICVTLSIEFGMEWFATVIGSVSLLYFLTGLNTFYAFRKKNSQGSPVTPPA